jgi:hypothetical protein
VIELKSEFEFSKMIRIFVLVSVVVLVESNVVMRFAYEKCLLDNAYLSLGDTCQLPNNQEGICSELIQCPPAKKLYDEKKYSEIPHCGFNKDRRSVCCARSAKFEKALCKKGTPQGVPGPYFRITNGKEAAPGEIPFQVALGRKSMDDPGEILFNCGGSLVADNVIISAAHCFSKETEAPTMARLGRVRSLSEK